MGELLRVKNLQVSYHTYAGEIKAVRDVSFSVGENEIVAIVGESGCGKSVTARSILGLIKRPAGEIKAGSKINFRGEDVVSFSGRRLREYRGGECSIVFQDPLSALNPVMRIGKQIAENILTHRDVSKKEALAEAVRILDNVGIEDPLRRLHQYPHELSGGMRQRVMIAIAFSCRPQLLIADEPTTALDVTIQNRVIELLKELHRETKTSIILITHDLGVVAGIAERVYVMYAGKIVESGSTANIFYHAQHPYTLALLASVPRMAMPNKEPLPFIVGTPPDLAAPPKGCAFAPRCIHCMNICIEQEPVLTGFGSGHFLACWLQSLENVAL